jgi:CubicO group peptidase (beta-lactamase class C family)
VTPIHGQCDPRFRAVREAFAENFATRDEVGAAVAVTIDGKSVVDLWGGHADAGRTRPWERDTIVHVWSTTKPLTALCAHVLIDRGVLDVEAPVARYWPEFAAGGKADVRVQHLLTHRAGLAAVRSPLPPAAIYDWKTMAGALAAQEPWWEPGAHVGYHVLTFGWLVGEVVRRVSGKSLGRFFRDEVSRPLEVDFHIGLAAEEDARTADTIATPPTDPGDLLVQALGDPESMRAKAFFNPPFVPELVNTRAWRATEIPAANGHGNARAVARLYGALARGGELDGVRLLRAATLVRATHEWCRGTCLVTGVPCRLGLGFALALPEWPLGPGAHSFGHPGAGGSLGFADPDARLGFGYTPNRMEPGFAMKPPRLMALVDAVYASL